MQGVWERAEKLMGYVSFLGGTPFFEGATLEAPGASSVRQALIKMESGPLLGEGEPRGNQYLLWMDKILHRSETLVSDDSPVITKKQRFQPWF